jgi:hypothetical protein
MSFRKWTIICPSIRFQFKKFQGILLTDTTAGINTSTHKPAIWVDYKDSMDAIEQYQLIANGMQFYSQNFDIE